MMMSTQTPVAVIGLGTMGHGIAQTFAVGGYPVRAFDEQAGPRESVSQRIRANLDQLVEAELLAPGDIDVVLNRISVCDSMAEAVAGTGFVTEAAWEDLDVKRALFAELESLVDESTILASNSSSYPISQTAERLVHPERAVVTHWFNPPHVIPLVEVVGGEATSAETVETACRLLEGIGKMAVRVNRELPGFLVNRIQVAMMREVWDLLDRGVASAEDIDRAVRGSMGLRLAAIGPLAVTDYAGWDVTATTYDNLLPSMKIDRELPDTIRRLLDNKHYGAKSGQGVYDYPVDELPSRLAERDRTYLQLVRLLHSPGDPAE